MVLGLARLIVLTCSQLPLAAGAPALSTYLLSSSESDPPKEPTDPSLWLYLGISAALVLSGGAFAGLTIALMGQDEVYLQVIKTSGEESEKKNAASVLNLLERGKHWVLVTLLLSNVITNETLPIVLDRTLGGGWPAVLGSTALIVIFGEVVPQSICVRYGLPIGAWMAPCVLILMYIMSPVAWPVAKLLDKLLGEDHGTIYKKAGLKTLVTLHRTLGEAGEQLNSDEVRRHHYDPNGRRLYHVCRYCPGRTNHGPHSITRILSHSNPCSRQPHEFCRYAVGENAHYL
jgi:metal transporter CNNM